MSSLRRVWIVGVCAGKIDPMEEMRDFERRVALAAQRIEARSDETLQAARPEGQEPDGEADAPSPSPLVGEQ